MKTYQTTLKVITVAAITVLLAACGKSNSKSTTGTGVLTPGVCANCNGVQNPILLGAFTSQSSNPSGFPVSINQGQIFGSGYGVGTGYPVTGYPGTGYPTTGYPTTGYTNNINTYQGAVSLQGVLVVGARIGDEVAVSYGTGVGTALPANYQGCIIEPGNYSMASTVAGQISYGTNLNIQELVAGNIRLKLEQGMVWRESNSLRVRGILRIISVGGRMCAPFYTNIL